MDVELIKEIAHQVVDQSILYNWKIYALLIALFLVYFVIKIFLESYFGKRGEQLARKSDLKGIIDEIKKTTEAVESIKNSIEADIWIKKEFNILRRQKLEELLILLYKHKEEVHKEIKQAVIDNQDFSRDTSIDRITAIHKLYFPELDDVMKEFYTAFTDTSTWIVEALQQKADERKQGKTHPSVRHEHLEKYAVIIGSITNSIGSVENRAKLVMNDLRRI